VNTLTYVTMDRRHCVINYESMSIYGTVEFRQFQGTINKVKILNWMRLTERFVARTADRKYKGREPMSFPKTIDGLCDFLGFGKYGVRRWAAQRAQSNGYGHLVTGSDPVAQNPQSSEESAPSANSPLWAQMTPRNIMNRCNHDNCNNRITDEDVQSQRAQYGPRAPITCASCEEDHQIALGESDVESAPSANTENNSIQARVDAITLELDNNYSSYEFMRELCTGTDSLRASQVDIVLEHVRDNYNLLNHPYVRNRTVIGQVCAYYLRTFNEEEEIEVARIRAAHNNPDSC